MAPLARQSYAMAPRKRSGSAPPPLGAATLGMLLVTMATTSAGATTADSTVHLTVEIHACST